MLASIATSNTISETEKLEAALWGIARQDSQALESLYTLTRDAVYAYALSLLKNTHDAEDLLHDCFVRIWQSAGDYEPMGKPLNWIFTITRNLCMGKLRQRKFLWDKPQEDWQEYIAQRPMEPDDRLLIEHCLNRLSSEEREIFLLHGLWGFKHREIARLLELPVSTVLSKYYRTVKKMRAWLHLEDRKSVV